MSTTYVEELRQKREGMVEEFDTCARRIKALPEDAPEEERDVLKQRFDRLKGSVERLTEDIDNAEAVAEARAKLAPQDDDEEETPGKEARRIHGIKEPLVYERNSGHSYFKDVWSVSSQDRADAEAQERLNRHMTQMRVEQRDISTTAGGTGEFVPPVYLQDQWIPLLRAGRPTANLMNSKPLIPGTMTYHFPKLSGGAATAIQTADNAAVQETDPTSADYSVGVKTIAGQVDISRQLYDFSNPGMDEIIMADLGADFATKLDIQVLSGSGAAGQALGVRNISSINTITYTQATPTAGTLYSQIANAWQTIGSVLFRPADAIVMHPRRWASLMAAVDTQGRPLATSYSPVNTMAQAGNESNPQGAVGSLQGLPVYVDPNLPTNIGAGTNQDIILVLRTAEMYLYEEGAPRTRVFESIGSGTQTVRISAWGYFAFAGGRYPGAISLITGTGLVAPVF